VLGKFFRAKEDSADEQDADKQETPQSTEPAAVVVMPVATTTEEGVPAVGWATLGVVPVPQCVPAAPGAVHRRADRTVGGDRRDGRAPHRGRPGERGALGQRRAAVLV